MSDSSSSTTAERTELAASLATRVRNLAWRLDRSFHEAYEHPRQGVLGRILAAADLAKEAFYMGPGNTLKAHSLLGRAICADIRTTGLTDERAVRLHQAIYHFLEEGLGMQYRDGEWVAPATPESGSPDAV
jgi:hypothetical protein